MPKSEENNGEAQYKNLVEEIAINVAKLSRQVAAILDGRLKKKSIVLLLAHSTNLPQRTVSDVLDAIVDLEKTHLK